MKDRATEITSEEVRRNSREWKGREVGNTRKCRVLVRRGNHSWKENVAGRVREEAKLGTLGKPQPQCRASSEPGGGQRSVYLCHSLGK